MSRDGVYKPSDSVIVTVPLDPVFHRRLRVHCAEQGRTMKWVMTKAIEVYMSNKEAMDRLGVVEDGSTPR